MSEHTETQPVPEQPSHDPNAPPATPDPAHPTPPAPQEGEHPSGGASGGGTGPGEQGTTATTTPAAPPTAVTTPGAPPGTEIPPARTAQPAGVVLTAEDYDLPTQTTSAGQPPAPSVAAEMAQVTWQADMVPAAQLDPKTAQARGAKMIGDVRGWLAASPHPFEGETAAVAEFFRNLEKRRLAKATGVSLGRPDEPDEIDAAKSEPPPELFQMIDLAGLAKTVLDGFAALMANTAVPEQLEEAASALRAKSEEILAKSKPPAPAEPVEPPAEVAVEEHAAAA